MAAWSDRVSFKTWNFLLYLPIFVTCVLCHSTDYRIFTREDLQPTIETFRQGNVKSFGQLMFDITRYQLIVGSRDYLFRLSLEGLRNLEEAHWPASDETVQVCMLKGKSQDECRNYIKVLLHHNGKVFACGTNAFNPECSWREINSLKTVTQTVDGIAKCPYSPDANNTALLTSHGDYYAGSTIDFSGQDAAIYRIMGNQTTLRTVKFDHKWLNEPNFVASYEVDDFILFFFRESASEYLNCGKTIYSRVARVCKNDKGGKYHLQEHWSTFLKARLNCSLPGDYPFYFNELQSIDYVEREQILYATFTTPPNSVYGSAICAYNVSSIHSVFMRPFKYQTSSKAAWEWEKQTPTHKHFQCQTPNNEEYYLDSAKYQLMNDAVLPITLKPLYNVELERLGHIVVDIVPTKDSDGVHVIFVSTTEGAIRKLVVVPQTHAVCFIEELRIFPSGTSGSIKSLKLLKDTSSLYIGTEDSILRVPIHRCNRFKTKDECLNAKDPYCGWNKHELACTPAPQRNPLSNLWLQEKSGCPDKNRRVDGGWNNWSPWFECVQAGAEEDGETCRCQSRQCNLPEPMNGGEDCQGAAFHVTNCTRNGEWTEWSSWSACTHPCGLAVKSRRRTCSNPAPAHGGKDCMGDRFDEIYCTSNPPCPEPTPSPIDGQWSDWTTWDKCSAPCGGGIHTRRRRCNLPPPSNGGRDCTGCNQEFRMCNHNTCPEVRKSTSWTPFLRVNKTRDGYFEQRFRFTCRANVPDEGMLRLGHMKKEERFCLEGSSDCLDTAFINLDGEWSEWSQWSECSSSCGGGVQFRQRFCDNPKPVGSGSECVGLGRMERMCNVIHCPDDREWEEWSIWSMCDDKQEQHRRRRCRVPQGSSSICKGATKETRMCIREQIDSEANVAEIVAAEDGIHAAHVGGAFITGLLSGGFLSVMGFYIYSKRKQQRRQKPAPTQLIPVNPNTYIDDNEWKNNCVISKSCQQKIPLREATIKRNGNFRAQIESDQMF